jgi:hypothetical protein
MRVRGKARKPGRVIGRVLGVAATVALAGGITTSPAGAAVTTSPVMWEISYLGGANTNMTGIAAFSGTDIWASGGPSSGSFVNANQNLLVHWNGVSWHAVSIPGSSGYLFGDIAGSAGNDLWVFAANKAGRNEAFRYDGAHWHAIAVPASSLGLPVVLSSKNVWLNNGPACQIPSGNTAWKCTSYVYHFDGTKWRKISIPGEFISQITASPSGAVLAVGNAPHNRTTGAGPVSAFRWNGHRWYALSMPHPQSSYMPQIAVDSVDDIWIDSVNPAVDNDALLHWDGHRWTTLASDVGFAGTPSLAADGHGGVWVGDVKHYTDGAWVIAEHDPSIEGETGDITDVAAVPGTADTYVEATPLVANKKPDRAVVLVYRPLP